VKKILALTTALFVALPMLFAGALADLQPDDIVGAWDLSSIKAEGVTLPAAEWGMEMTMVFNEDNTAIALMAGEEADEAGTWSIVDGKLYASANESDMVFTPVDDTLVVEEDGMKMVFGREKAEAEAVEISPARTDAALSDFNGTWNAYLAGYEGMVFPIEAFGLEMAMVIEGGKATLTSSGESIEMEGDVSAGVLTITAGDADDEAFSFSFTLHEDGTVSCVLEESITLYFQKMDRVIMS